MLPNEILMYMGLLLFIASLASLNILLFNKDEIGEVMSNKVREFAKIIYAVGYSTVFAWLAGTMYVTSRGDREVLAVMMELSSTILWIVLLALNIFFTIIALKAGFKFGLCRDFIDALTYSAVVVLFFDSFPVDVNLGVMISTVCVVTILYFMSLIYTYKSIFEELIIPVNLYESFLGLAAFSLLVSLTYLAHFFNLQAVWGLISVGYLVLTIAMLYTVLRLRDVVRLAA
ncbi:hypothetical protein [Archaeoglobus veneficus]|uniref:Uncharacterized protein n=1 Tax=Archaeoglobus veneficus (strain DSM 11195 / SNP6) TaxID=693661 RepID=F2KMS8_ARCVS|nr:hypothetical protein [Archaeoglobus veneficus]AEA46102.1 hypothetical protein Arcve_0060 [Archaeoglobus veneficus SNP6]